MKTLIKPETLDAITDQLRYAEKKYGRQHMPLPHWCVRLGKQMDDLAFHVQHTRGVARVDAMKRELAQIACVAIRAMEDCK